MAYPDMYPPSQQQKIDRREEYKKSRAMELVKGNRAKLEKELHNMEEYRKIVTAGEVDDTLDNIDYLYFKIGVLKELLEIKEP